MSSTIDRQSRANRELDVPSTLRGPQGLAAIALLALLGSACAGDPAISGQNPMGGTGGSASATGGTSPGVAGSSTTTTAGTGSGTGGTAATSTGGVMLRLLTQTEYRNSIKSLLGDVTAQLTLPNDTSIAGFVAVGAAHVSVSAAEVYESASLAATAEVFADAQRWQELVGCQPQPDLSDACVTTFIQSFGKRAFRRDLTAEEVQQWVGVAKNAAMLAGNAAQGLASVTSGLLQSPNFLYRVETNKLDSSNGRLKYDGLSMATRLSYSLSGGPPSAELLAAAASGQLDTPEGVRAAATPLLADAGSVDRLVAFFTEFAAAQQVLVKTKSTTLFPMYNAALQSSMFQSAQLFVKNVVLAPGADVRSFYDSNQAFTDAALAPIYGVQAPASGFAQVTLGPETGRAGILGQPAVLAGESQPDRSSPTRRGVFILQTLLCQIPPPPPQGVNTALPQDPNATERQILEQHRVNPACKACHAAFDPLGLALEHFDAIGQYRATEKGLPIDATGALEGVPFDGAAQLGSVLRQNATAISCLMRNFYRNANARTDDQVDTAPIEAMVQALATRNYVWRDLVADFVASDAFRSAPALPAGNP